MNLHPMSPQLIIDEAQFPRLRIFIQELGNTMPIVEIGTSTGESCVDSESITGHAAGSLADAHTASTVHRDDRGTGALQTPDETPDDK